VVIGFCTWSTCFDLVSAFKNLATAIVHKDLVNPTYFMSIEKPDKNSLPHDSELKFRAVSAAKTTMPLHR
jgi:hypothetical protein